MVFSHKKAKRRRSTYSSIVIMCATLTVLIAVIPAITAFLVSPLQRQSFGVHTCSQQQLSLSKPKPALPRRQSSLSMSVMDDSMDPFQILNLSPTADQKEIKRAYKRMALKYHPDVVTNQDTSTEARKQANDEFAKINWAYAQLSGKTGTTSGTTTPTSSSSTSSSSSSSYTPPHRRKSSWTYNPNQASTDWRDYMPTFDDDQVYDTGGDSFEKILSDLVKGAAVGAAGVAGGGKGIFRDFVEFLERNVDGYAAGGGADGDDNDDAQLRILLNTGSLEDVGMEMDDTELVVQQLDVKKRNLADELIMRQADAKIASAYLERMELDEKVAELEARKQVVDGYLKKARKRLLALQTRYKELIVRGDNDVRAGGRSYSWEPKSSSSPSSPGATSSASSRGTSSDDGRTDSTTASSDEDAWKHEGFGSSGRSRGSSRRSSRTRDTRSTFSSQQYPSSSEKAPSPPRQDSSFTPRQPSASRAQSSSATPSEPWTPPVPPHRRPFAETQAQKDKKRLRELQVDDAFDQLKKDLGL
jgi:DnaJ domain